MHRQANVKRRRQDGAQPLKHGGKRANRMDWQDEEISSNDEEEGNGLESEQESDDYEESAESKRLRLAKQYLSQMKAGDADEDSASDASSDDARVSNKLKTTRLRERGELFEDLVPHFRSLDVEECTRRDLTGHTGAITCISLTKDETTMVSSSKDNSVLKWDVETGSKTVLRQKWNSTMDYQSSMGEMLSVAVSHDGRYVAAGGRDSSVRIYDQRQKYAEVKELKGHRGAVTSLCFRMDSYTLFSSSLDRCMKHWEINDLAYVETMFGHQDGVLAVDCWNKEKPLSVSSDRTVRLWKVAEETHLVFRGHKASIDCVQYLTDSSFVSAGQDGTLCLWKDTQKHPARTVPAAHGLQQSMDHTGAGAGAGSSANWISSLAAVKMSNVVATGSCDGFVRLWSADADERRLDRIAEVAMPGCVNSLALTPRLLVAGCGREHKYGRWWSLKGNLNKIRIVRLDASLLDSADDEADEEDQDGTGTGDEESDGAQSSYSEDSDD